MEGVNVMFWYWFMMIHEWLCEFVFGGQLPDWLLWLHELLGIV